MNQLREIDKQIIDKVVTLFEKSRVICLLRYGPKSKANGAPPSDFDYLILLNTYQNTDYLLASKFKEQNLPIEVFIDYKDEILIKGIKNYQRGRHGSYFFKILASADTLLGSNFYSNNQEQLVDSKIKSDLLYRIEEYFYRIQKSIINDKSLKRNEIEKYLGRILTDLLLVSGNIDFKDMHKYHYTTILKKISDKNEIIPIETTDNLIQLLSETKLDINLLGEVIGVLYKQYLSLQKRTTNDC